MMGSFWRQLSAVLTGSVGVVTSVAGHATEPEIFTFLFMLRFGRVAPTSGSIWPTIIKVSFCGKERLQMDTVSFYVQELAPLQVGQRCVVIQWMRAYLMVVEL